MFTNKSTKDVCLARYDVIWRYLRYIAWSNLWASGYPSQSRPARNARTQHALVGLSKWYPSAIPPKYYFERWPNIFEVWQCWINYGQTHIVILNEFKWIKPMNLLPKSHLWSNTTRTVPVTDQRKSNFFGSFLVHPNCMAFVAWTFWGWHQRTQKPEFARHPGAVQWDVRHKWHKDFIGIPNMKHF